MHMERQETGGKVFSDLKILRHFGIMSYNSPDPRIPGSPDPRIPGSPDPRIPGSPNMQPRGGNERGVALPSSVIVTPAFPPA